MNKRDKHVTISYQEVGIKRYFSTGNQNLDEPEKKKEVLEKAATKQQSQGETTKNANRRKDRQ